MEHTTDWVRSTPTIADVLDLAQCGFRLHPLHPGTKRPTLTGWKTKATDDPTTLREWWRTWPRANIGHVLPRGRLVLDIDPRNNGLTHWRNLLAQHGDLPATWTVWSGRNDGGFHLYLRVPAGIDIPYVTDLADGVQALGYAHNVLLPPSLHPETGLPYTWDAQLSPFAGCDEAEAPLWLLDLVQAHTKVRTPRTTPAKPPEKASLPESKQGTQSPRRSTLFAPAKPAPSPSPGATVVALACTPTSLPGMLEACGLPSTLQVGQTTHCPMHDDEHPSAVLLGPTEQHPSFGLYCHASACNRYYSLVDIYHDQASGNALQLHTEIDATGRTRDHAALRLQWTTRLLEAADVLHIQEVGAPTLPPHAPDEARDLWRIFLHVRRIRGVTRKASAPMPFSLRFIQDWAGRFMGRTIYTVNAAKRWLVTHGFLELAFKDGLETYWRVGSPALRRARSDAPVYATERDTLADVATTVVPEPVQPTSACPDEGPAHQPFVCELCRYQARLLEKRRQTGVTLDYANPYG